MPHPVQSRTLVVLGRGASHLALRALLEEARRARSSRTAAAGVDGERTAALIEESLRLSERGTVDCAAYFHRLATRHQLVSGSIREMHVRIDPLVVNRRYAAALAATLTEIVHFVESGVEPQGCVDLYLAIAIEDGSLLVALAARGDFQLVGSCMGMCALQRATRIAEAIGATLGRGADAERMLFGITMPVVSTVILGRRSR